MRVAAAATASACGLRRWRRAWATATAASVRATAAMASAPGLRRRAANAGYGDDGEHAGCGGAAYGWCCSEPGQRRRRRRARAGYGDDGERVVRAMMTTASARATAAMASAQGLHRRAVSAGYGDDGERTGCGGAAYGW